MKWPIISETAQEGPGVTFLHQLHHLFNNLFGLTERESKLGITHIWGETISGPRYDFVEIVFICLSLATSWYDILPRVAY